MFSLAICIVGQFSGPIFGTDKDTVKTGTSSGSGDFFLTSENSNAISRQPKDYR